MVAYLVLYHSVLRLLHHLLLPHFFLSHLLLSPLHIFLPVHVSSTSGTQLQRVLILWHGRRTHSTSRHTTMMHTAVAYAVQPVTQGFTPHSDPTARSTHEEARNCILC